MKHFLVTFDKDWADEFSVEGAAVYTEEKWEEQKKLFKLYGDTETGRVFFGTNEGWEDPEPFGDLEYCYKAHEISEQAYAELKKINSGVFGMYKSPQEFLGQEAEEDYCNNIDGSDDDDDDFDDEVDSFDDDI